MNDNLSKKGECILQRSKTKRAGSFFARVFPYFAARGSMTIEAALVMPLFLFAVLSILSVMDMIRIYEETELKLYRTARDAAVFGYAAEGGNDWVRLSLVYPAKGRGAMFAKTLLLENHVNVHVFCGYTGDDGQMSKERDRYVYVTEGSEVYHTRRSCSHLNVSVRAVSYSGVGGLRNEDGSRFHLCRYCGRGMSEKDLSGTQVYVTDYGGLYHTRVNCPDLKRTVYVVLLSEVSGKRPCRDCGG